MENQNPQISPTSPTSPQNIPTEQPTPISNPISPSADGPKSKFSFGVIIGIILFLLIAGSAAGFYVFKQQSSKLAAKPTPTPSQTIMPSPTPDPTANWKIYENINLGFSIKYPSDFAPEKCPQDWIPNSNLCSDKLDNSVEPLYYFLSFSNEPILPDTTGFSGIKTNYKEEIINGITVERTTDLPSQSGTEYVFFKKPNGGYVLIGFSPYDANKKFPQQDKYYSLYNQILSTFKFTDLSTTPTPTCMQRPACLDATPRCMIPEPANGWCPANQTCNSDADCASGSSCMASGPLVAGQAVRKICVQKGSAVPL